MPKPDSNLSAYLCNRIKNDGPISVANYMTEVLGHPDWGYYNTRDPFGRSGDFITAPEVSQMFGELIGLWAAAVWQLLEMPKDIRLLEFGPGRGTLMCDALRAIQQTMPEFYKTVSVDLFEMSPVLKRLQSETLNEQHRNIEINWREKIELIPSGPCIIIANEFFDALPIHQYIKSENGWRERLVGLANGDRLCFEEGSVIESGSIIPEAFKNASIGNIVELSPARESFVSELSRHIKSQRGVCLIIDYGYTNQALGDSLQAVKSQKYSDLFNNPGEADVTSHVDFFALSDVAKNIGCCVHGPITQKRYLEQLGIQVRAEQLAADSENAKVKDIHHAHVRLTGEDEMGTLFKVLAISDPDIMSLPGFE